MNLLIIGAGSIGTRHMRNVLHGQYGLEVERLVVLDTNEGRLKAAEEIRRDNPKVSSVRYMRGMPNLLSWQAYNAVDGVIICTPPHEHMDYAQRFPEVPILVEKPITWWEHWEWLDTKRAKKGSGPVLAAMNMRFHPGVNWLRGWASEPGIPEKVVNARAWYRFKGGRMPGSPDAELEPAISVIHDLDALVWLLGEDGIDVVNEGDKHVIVSSLRETIVASTVPLGIPITLEADFSQNLRERGAYVTGVDEDAGWSAFGGVRAFVESLTTTQAGSDYARTHGQSVEINQMFVDELREFIRLCGDGDSETILPKACDVAELAKHLGHTTERMMTRLWG